MGKDLSSIWDHLGINSDCIKILKEDRNHEEEMASSLNEYKLNDQT